MKKVVLISIASLMFILGGSSLFAQGKYGADSAECIKYLSYYKEYYKQKSYDLAMPNWRKAYKLCPPTANQNMLIDGTNLLRRLIAKNSRNQEYKKALVDSLLKIHDIRAEYYSKYAVTSMNNKGLDMINYIQNDNNALYNGLNQIIAANKSKVKSSILLLDMKSAIELYKEGLLQPEDVISTYQTNMGYLEEILKDSKASEIDAKIKEDMESLFITSKVASCDKLIALFTPKYEADPNNLELVTNIVKMLSTTDDCTDNDLYIQAATSMYQLKPSAQAAYFLFKLNASRDNVNEAIKYLEEAIASPDVDKKDLAEYNYELAAYCIKSNMKLKAINAASKVVEQNPEMAGKAYYLIATIWSSLKPSGDEIAQRSKYWVAVDYLLKAKAADPSLASDCNNLIKQFSVYYPTAADAFMYNLTEGNSYSVTCEGLKATTTVRTQK